MASVIDQKPERKLFRASCAGRRGRSSTKTTSSATTTATSSGAAASSARCSSKVWPSSASKPVRATKSSSSASSAGSRSAASSAATPSTSPSAAGASWAPSVLRASSASDAPLRGAAKTTASPVVSMTKKSSAFSPSFALSSSLSQSSSGPVRAPPAFIATVEPFVPRLANQGGGSGGCWGRACHHGKEASPDFGAAPLPKKAGGTEGCGGAGGRCQFAFETALPLACGLKLPPAAGAEEEEEALQRGSTKAVGGRGRSVGAGGGATNVDDDSSDGADGFAAGAVAISATCLSVAGVCLPSFDHDEWLCVALIHKHSSSDFRSNLARSLDKLSLAMTFMSSSVCPSNSFSGSSWSTRHQPEASSLTPYLEAACRKMKARFRDAAFNRSGKLPRSPGSFPLAFGMRFGIALGCGCGCDDRFRDATAAVLDVSIAASDGGPWAEAGGGPEGPLAGGSDESRAPSVLFSISSSPAGAAQAVATEPATRGCRCGCCCCCSRCCCCC
mmetsp:Transcript_99882/g.322008  ORF Transcript_99882/g.322008 Transcript_99882/m.322008 type:complete len:502 (-) Transcript_99882:47-1552(-)